MYFHSDYLNNLFSRNGIKIGVIIGKIFQFMCVVQDLVIAYFWEAISISLYSYACIMKYVIWNRDKSGIKSLKIPVVPKTPSTPKTCNPNEIKIFKTLLPSWNVLPAWLHIVTVSILCRVPAIIWNHMSINFLGLGFILSAKTMSKCLRDNRCSDLKSSYLWWGEKNLLTNCEKKLLTFSSKMW